MEWVDGRYSTYYAKMGEATVGHVSYAVTRNDPLPWKAMCEGFGRRAEKSFAELDEAKAAMPRMLASILRHVVAND